jgi:hypothetical protein
MSNETSLPFEPRAAQAEEDGAASKDVGDRQRAEVLPAGRTFKAVREARQIRKRSEAREVEQAREYLGAPAPLTLTAQSVYHWNRDDQVRALVAVRDAGPDIGFMVRLMALCALPRTDPGERRQWRRVNGPYELFMTATGRERLPFGVLPRLLMAWVCTEAVRTGRRKLMLGHSLAEFMRRLGMGSRSGGERGDVRRIQDQMRRLFATAVHVEYEDPDRAASVGLMVVERTELWWDRRGDHPALWQSTIELGEKFFEEVLRRPVPIDLGVLRAMKRSSLGLDLYLWLTYRLFRVSEPFSLTWWQIYRQFAAAPGKANKQAVHDFRKKVLRELRKLKTAWPELDYRLPRGRLVLRPAAPRVAPLPPA